MAEEKKMGPVLSVMHAQEPLIDNYEKCYSALLLSFGHRLASRILGPQPTQEQCLGVIDNLSNSLNVFIAQKTGGMITVPEVVAIVSSLVGANLANSMHNNKNAPNDVAEGLGELCAIFERGITMAYLGQAENLKNKEEKKIIVPPAGVKFN